MILNRKITGLKRRFIILTLIIFTLQCQTSQKGLSAQQNNKPDSLRTVMRGLYIPNHRSRNMNFIKSLITKGKPLGINMFVFDVHTFGSTRLKINAKIVEYAKEENIYLAARIVCFQDGIERLPVHDSKLKGLYELVSAAADSGFEEIQLDYIRFQDGGIPYPLKKKYEFIEGLLSNFRKLTDSKKIKLSADIFGRIVYNRNDYIGQKMEVFAPYMDVLYPMLYPSHFTGDRQKMSEPGETVKEGTLKGLKRVEGGKVLIQPYIQAFPYNIQYARVKLEQYVALQIKAVEETGARGWVAWNPNGDYSSVFNALGNEKP